MSAADMGQPLNFRSELLLDERVPSPVSAREHPSKALLRTVFREERFFLLLSVFIGIFSGLAVVAFVLRLTGAGSICWVLEPY